MIEYTKTIIVHVDQEYDYVVTVSDDQLSLIYREGVVVRSTITFGSKEEMLATAKAMLDIYGE